MSSQASRSEGRPSSFERLDPKVQQWVWRLGWQRLHDVQERSIPPVLARTGDLIISAATAAGKTEAAMLPIASSLVADPISEGFGGLCISPLKALINDQHQRLELLCEAAGLELTSWHGDIGAEPKRRARERPSGVLLITPESLESIFVNHGANVAKMFGALRYVVVDELHAFIGSERGRQLQSLLHRVELATRRPAMRIGLSATLGEIEIAADFLRPGAGDSVEILESREDTRTLMVQVRGYLAAEPPTEPDPDEESPDQDRLVIAEHLFATLRGTDNLVFANSRRSVEEFADLLRRRCEAERVPAEFFPHHGSLAKSLREDVEELLRDPSRPTTAICTSTLELGIDVGSVTSVAQIDPPFSAAALRQRLGRSGRGAGDPSILRMYVTESPLGPGTAPGDDLREGLVQSIALVEALIDGWCEPPADGALHLSTLVQQLLSVIAQHGGALADDIWSALCGSGPFELDRQDFVRLLRGLAERDVIQQTGDRELILTPRGEQIVGHYSFYAAFRTSEEYRLLADGRELGSLPISSPLSEDSYLIFGGRRWRVLEVDDERKLIVVARASGGKVPRFFGAGGEIHDEIRRRMREVYESDRQPRFLDPDALRLLAEGRAGYRRLGLPSAQIIPYEGGAAYFPWFGDRAISTLALGIRGAGHHVEAQGQALLAPRTAPQDLMSILAEVFGPGSDLDPVGLAGSVENLATEKHHWLVEPHLLLRDCASSRLDLGGARRAVGELKRELPAAASAPSLPSVEGPRFVVVDCETTGLHPSAQHRIVELALLSVDQDGEITDRWCSLLNPGRDLGPTAIHGIHGREVAAAPSFAEILGEVTERLTGRFLVAHNARFDRSFLESELGRCGIEVSPLPTICTMQLASRLAIGGTRRRLDDCRETLGLDGAGAHSALADAEASAAVLKCYLDRYGAAIEAQASGRMRPHAAWPQSDERAAPKSRSPAALASPTPSSLSALISTADLEEGRHGEDVTAYFELLDRAIEDRRLDQHEQDELVATAAMLGIGRQNLQQLHRDYLESLRAAALRDGEISEREREDLFLVAEALGVDQGEDEASAQVAVPAKAGHPLQGTTVCFTGALVCRHEGQPMTRARAVKIAARAGLTVLPRVTRELDILVVADPYSTSEKARKAREHGVRIIAEPAFWEMIGVEVT
jgi:ATP-dependent Lhr-like helicase